MYEKELLAIKATLGVIDTPATHSAIAAIKATLKTASVSIHELVDGWTGEGYGLALVDAKTNKVIDPYVNPDDYTGLEFTANRDGAMSTDGKYYIKFHNGILESDPDYLNKEASKKTADAVIEKTTIDPELDADNKLLPYKKQQNTPTGFPWKEYSLKIAEKAKKSMGKLETLTETVKDIEQKVKDIKQEGVNKAAEFAQEKGLEALKLEQAQLTNKLIPIIQKEFKDVSESLDASKKLLLSLNECVYTVYTKVTEYKITEIDKLEAIMNAMNSLLAPELVKAITEAADKSLAQIKIADTKSETQFIGWDPPQDMLKKIKEVLPKNASVVTAGIFDFIKEWFSGIVTSIKNWLSPVEESVADLQATLEQTEPMVAELNALTATL